VRPLRSGEEKKIEDEDRKKPQDENIMVCPIRYGGATIIEVNVLMIPGHNDDRMNKSVHI